jgi:hypothetical protein
MIKFKRLLFFITGVIIICIYLFLRLIYTRPSVSLNFIYILDNKYYINISLIIFISILFGISLFYIIFFIKKYMNKEITVSNTILVRILVFIVSFIKKALLTVNEIIAEKIPDSYKILKTLGLVFYKFFGNKELLLVFVFNIIPYMLLSISFIIDTFTSFELHYFYKTWPVIILPVFFNTWIFLINELLKNMSVLEEDFIVTHSFKADGTDDFVFEPRNDLNAEQIEEFKYYVNEYLILYPLKGFITYYNSLEDFYKNLSLFIMYNCYFYCCVYIITINVLNILDKI